jgi:hypothetical protein
MVNLRKECRCCCSRWHLHTAAKPSQTQVQGLSCLHIYMSSRGVKRHQQDNYWPQPMLNMHSAVHYGEWLGTKPLISSDQMLWCTCTTAVLLCTSFLPQGATNLEWACTDDTTHFGGCKQTQRGMQPATTFSSS